MIKWENIFFCIMIPLHSKNYFLVVDGIDVFFADETLACCNFFKSSVRGVIAAFGVFVLAGVGMPTALVNSSLCPWRI